MDQTAILISDDGQTGSPTSSMTTSPDITAGDREFFVDDPKRPVQVRPVLPSEALPGRPLKRGEWVLVALNSFPQLRAFVRLPPHLRKNNAAGVEAAIRRVDRFSPELGELFRAATKVPKGAVVGVRIPHTSR